MIWQAGAGRVLLSVDGPIHERGSLMTAGAGNLGMDVRNFQATEIGPVPRVLHDTPFLPPTHKHAGRHADLSFSPMPRAVAFRTRADPVKLERV